MRLEEGEHQNITVDGDMVCSSSGTTKHTQEHGLFPQAPARLTINHPIINNQ